MARRPGVERPHPPFHYTVMPAASVELGKEQARLGRTAQWRECGDVFTGVCTCDTGLLRGWPSFLYSFTYATQASETPPQVRDHTKHTHVPQPRELTVLRIRTLNSGENTQGRSYFSSQGVCSGAGFSGGQFRNADQCWKSACPLISKLLP